MQQLYVFGTGNANARHCYNTCFALRKGAEYFMIDAGGGNGIVSILDKMNVPLKAIHHLFVTHEHTDHILGVVWMVRLIAAEMKKGQYDGDFHIYCHAKLRQTIETLCDLTVQKKFTKLIGERILLHPLKDDDHVEILGNVYRFFDIQSTKAKQFGFTTTLDDGKTLCFAGDEPLSADCQIYAKDADWLLHEAFCLYADRDVYHPYEKHHSTVREACEMAAELHVKNLLLWHTEDDDLPHRKENYTAEGRLAYAGKLFVPNDGEILDL